MKFGSVIHPELIDFKLPADHTDTKKILKVQQASEKNLNVYVGCAKWNRQDLKGFYPRGTKDELTYYSSQFNCIELNATFYRVPSAKQVEIWRDKTPDEFKFFPKISNTISHLKRLNGVETIVDEYCTNISAFESKLGMVFLQMHDNFKFKDFDRLKRFIENFPTEIPIAVELRNQEWFNDQEIRETFFGFLQDQGVTNIIVDTAGRRDMLHMRLTTPTAFVRYVGANHKSDYTRLNDWIERLKVWIDLGLENLYFFVHQNIEVASPLLSAYFIKKLNQECGFNLHIPDSGTQEKLLF